MKKIKLVFTLIAVAIYLIPAQAQQLYHRAKIYADKVGLKELSALGIAVDHGEIKQGYFIISDFSDQELALAESKGFKTERIINNIQEYYRTQKPLVNNTNERANNLCGKPLPYKTPKGFKTGTMGGFYTYAEMIAAMDSMYARFPNLITPRTTIGTSEDTTVEGRRIFYMKISDNASSAENEPQVLYTAVHHAREPQSMMQTIYYMYYLLENYQTDSSIRYIVDHTELYFVPCVNPDGYIYNETTDPSGGGLWRKNRKVNVDQTMGVDLNRNYGYSWGYDNVGSSNVGNSQTFRGDSAFSEKETQIIKKFCESKKFVYAANAHSWGNLLIYPWGYTGDAPPDSAYFENAASALIAENHYTHGTDEITVHYNTNGTSDDWMYGEQKTKNKTFAFTPEIGGGQDGFWPNPNRIETLCSEILYQNLTMARLASIYAEVKDETPYLIGTKTGYIYYTIQRLGLDSTANYTVKIEPIEGLASVGAPKVYTNLALMQSIHDSIAFTIDTQAIAGSRILYKIVNDLQKYKLTDTSEKRYGPISLPFQDACNNTNNWSSSDVSKPWEATSLQFYSSNSSITDSKVGNYEDNNVTALTSANSIDLTDALEATLNFHLKKDIETRYDFLQVQVANDQPTGWYSLCGKHTKPGGSNASFPEPIYDGNDYQWLSEEINLHDYIGKNIYLQFILTSDQGANQDGVYLDDIEVRKISKQKNIGIESMGSQLMVYGPDPNPTGSNCKIYWNSLLTEPTMMTVYDLQGKVCLQENIAIGKTSHLIATDALASGTYYVKMQGAVSLFVTKKLIVVH
jgi:hypothetical protein